MIFEDKMNTVLIIDDEPFNTEWLADYFRARGFEVVEADDLQSALYALEKTRYRYVIIDLSIPVSPALKRFPPDLNRRDSLGLVDERVFGH